MIKKWISSMVTILMVIACQNSDDNKQEEIPIKFDLSLQLQNIYDLEISKLNSRFVIEVEKLQNTVSDFENELTLENQRKIQKQWKTAISLWKRLEIFNVGPIFTNSFKAQFHEWPANQRLIQSFLENTEIIDEEFISKKGVTVRGLSAIEFLSYGKSIDSYTTGNLASKQLNYLKAITADLVAKARKYNSTWKEFEIDFKTNTRQNTRGSQNQLFNAIVFKLEEIAKRKLGKPSGIITGNIPNELLVEAFFSGYSLQIIKEEINQIERVFTGEYIEGTNTGFYAQLESVDRKDLVIILKKQFDKVDSLSNQIKPSLKEQLKNDNDEVLKLYSAINQLITYVKTDASSAMGITVTLNDNDGD